MEKLPPRDQGPTEDQLFDRIAEALRDKGYVTLPAALPDGLVDGLFKELKNLEAPAFHSAGIGRQDEFKLNTFVRRDKIHWLRGETEITQSLLQWMGRLREGLNRRLLLGLFDYECHYAVYPTGAFYKKHFDAFKGQSNRVLSTVLYLNPQWQPSDGGELLLYGQDGNAKLERIFPSYGKLVIFLSEEFPHEVLPAKRTRYSIAGWFRVNNSFGIMPDPPE